MSNEVTLLSANVLAESFIHKISVFVATKNPVDKMNRPTYRMCAENLINSENI